LKTIQYTCETCESSYTIEYDVEGTETDPIYCPFCSNYIDYEVAEIGDE